MAAHVTMDPANATSTTSVAAAADAATISLSLISHTNVGKTTLMRTLLRRDLGEVADRAHVTEEAESHALIETPQGDLLRLWDTPGFGDSARLLKRLRISDNPIGWLVTQVWDRLTDRPFFSSQQAIRNARDQSDVILYLVNAAEQPASAGYIDAEMQILAWIEKPVLLLLNQVGAPQSTDLEARDELLWRRHLSLHSRVRGILSLDAFARCWVQEDKLLATVGGFIPVAKETAFARLHAAWRERNLDVFDASMKLLAKQIATIATDRESGGIPADFRGKAGRWLGSLLSDRDSSHPEEARAMNALATRLDQVLRETTDRLLALHGLSGSAGATILARVSGNFNVAKKADPRKSGVIGGVVSGALGGLAADLAAGGLTLGAGAVIGGIIGALGGSGAAAAYNLARGATDGKVGWSAEFLAQRPLAALLRYLAVAHYGRGRGDWSEGEYPPHWQGVVEEVVAQHWEELGAALRAPEIDAGAEAVAERLHPALAVIGADVLLKLYPDSRELFAAS